MRAKGNLLFWMSGNLKELADPAKMVACAKKT